MKLIRQEIAPGQQSVNYVGIFETSEGKKLRVTIRSDSYDFQSYARVAVLKDDKWNVLDSIFYHNMATKHKLIYKPKKKWPVELFATDRDKLIDNALELLT